MKRSYYDQIQDLVTEVALKTEGLAYLFGGFKPDATGPRDIDARQGVALILEDLAKQSREVAGMLDERERRAFGSEE